ncbi:ATPase/histidine kinase/DNA gyrase B/HSP90 domain protein [Bacteroides pyogenes F0041]|uniref:histidine kinase n=1 Tax=Bacteroides pyogenes F0041 TaxID=1321819 RepID=U2CKY5_9BACE|nr:HAMP domain-containing sensor histidine kinase [Bacteroides pyogenes]ERI84713.1 ATPase/histidine kinase/DNA gyrase B/HSP90 domain protein [Bacteroides pyogenes F0041]MBB3895353.1 signal transduction histidine kinase [Bacteroides pyogenes]SUV70659.1 two-component system sensor histidine kinase [Bacteroides pyogenes]
MSRFHAGCLFLILSYAVSAKAQKEAEAFNVSPELYAYYQHCQKHLMHPSVMNMADTLFHMAEKLHDKRMQAVALSTQLEYHYYQSSNEDSVIHYANKVKMFSKRTQQPKYYYFAWGNRLILYYLKTGRSNIALYEAEKMLKEAQKEDSKIGLLYCYSVMSQIYTIKKLNTMAFEWRLKEIELTEKYKLENYNITNTYIQLADYYIEEHQQEKAFDALAKASNSSNSASHKVWLQLGYVNYYSTFGDFQKAEKALEECKEMFEKDQRLKLQKKGLYRTEYIYYQKTGQFQKALEAIENQRIEEQRLNEHIQNSSRYRAKGEIYSRMGKLDTAVDYLMKYIKAEDSLKIANERLASSEFANLLNVELLNAEKKELILQAQKKEIRTKTGIAALLSILLGIVFFFLYRENSLNRKLKASEKELKLKNEELIISREEVRKARDRAEAESRMKTTFIQSMSHEIRTPLNSIVGFSEVLSDRYKEDTETTEFAEIIKSNSQELLRLITDVLALSELDQHEKLPSDIKTDINITCLQAIDTASACKDKEITVSFRPIRNELVILSNPDRVTQLLTGLMHNAVKFTNHGNIDISYTESEEKKQLQIHITDTGIGIPIEKQEEVFERFYKVNPFSQGTGLGLSICRNIAEKLGGSLQVDSSYTGGCRMVLTLPLVYA